METHDKKLNEHLLEEVCFVGNLGEVGAHAGDLLWIRNEDSARIPNFFMFQKFKETHFEQRMALPVMAGVLLDRRPMLNMIPFVVTEIPQEYGSRR